MPGRFFLSSSLEDIAAEFACERGDAIDPGPRLDAAPGETVAAIVGADEAGPRRIVEMRWGMIPMGRTNARGRPVMETIINARSETLFARSAFADLRRCILPVSGWYEWTGQRRRKTRWAISDPDTPLLAFAAVWDVWAAPGGTTVANLATVTVPPNADVEPIHHRMGAILPPEDQALWLGEVEGDPSSVPKSWPDGRLRIVESDLA